MVLSLLFEGLRVFPCSFQTDLLNYKRKLAVAQDQSCLLLSPVSANPASTLNCPFGCILSEKSQRTPDDLWPTSSEH